MKTVILLALCLFGILSCPNFALAYLDGQPEVPVLVQKADVICIAKVVAIKQVTPTKFEANHGGPIDPPVLIDAQSAVAEVTVQSVLKGKIGPKSIEVAFFKNVLSGFNPSPFTELAAGETDILFLKTTDDGTYFTLSQPSSYGKSKISIGDAKIGPVPAATPPLRAVLLVLTEALVSGNKPVRMDCLDRLGSTGYLLYAKAKVYADEAAVAGRSALGEPLIADGVPSSLEEFTRIRVLPAVLRLVTDKDTDLREQAVLAAGRLQDVSVVPALAKLADKQFKPGELGMAANAFSGYRNPAATRALVGVLGDTNPNVRVMAAAALRDSADPVAVPSLLEHLDDPDPRARYNLAAALLAANNMPSYPGTEDFKDDEDKYVTFWKKWSADHQDKVAALREQFLAPLPPQKTPPQGPLSPAAH